LFPFSVIILIIEFFKEHALQFFRRWSRVFASLLLVLATTTLIQGVGHEFFHETGETHSHIVDLAITCDCHGEDCHSDHHACSSLSCSQGASFIGASVFSFLHIAKIEFLRPDGNTFSLPLVVEDFFKPPISSVC